VSSGSASPVPTNDQLSLPVQLSVKTEQFSTHPVAEPPVAITVAVTERLENNPGAISPLADRSTTLSATTGAKRRLSSESVGCDALATVTTSSKGNTHTIAIPPKRVPAFEAEG